MKPNTATSSSLVRGRVWLVVFGVLLIVVIVASMAIGKYPIGPGELVRTLLGRLVPGATAAPTDVQLVVFGIRLPRIAAAVLIGAGLSAAGAGFQSLFRNPMASPDILGASAGAGFGAAMAIYLGLGFAAVSGSAFVFGLVAVGAAYLVSTRARRNPTLGLVLAGIMISSLFTSATSLVKLVADPDNVLPAITFWLMGSLSSVTGLKLAWAAGPVLVGLVVLFVLRWKLNLLTMGEDEARSMGLNTRAVRVLVVLAATLVTAACSAIAGLIGWVGLVIPHFARMLVGADNRLVMPTSMLVGASFLLLVDDLARGVTTSEIPIGILTAFVGAPFFLYLVIGRGNRM